MNKIKAFKVVGPEACGHFQRWFELMKNTQTELLKLNEEFQQRDHMIREEMARQGRVHYESLLTEMKIDAPNSFNTGEWYIDSRYFEDFGDAYIVHDPDAVAKTEVRNQITGRPPGMPQVPDDDDDERVLN